MATADPTKPLSDEDAMELALAEARLAGEEGEVPVGAVALIDGRVVAARHNEREAAADPTAHAEILALRDAAVAAGGWRLDAVTLVVTLEPCPMCAGALVAGRVRRIVFGASDPGRGPAARSTTSARTPGSTTSSMSPVVSPPRRAGICCPPSSRRNDGIELPARLRPVPAPSSESGLTPAAAVPDPQPAGTAERIGAAST